MMPSRRCCIFADLSEVCHADGNVCVHRHPALLAVNCCLVWKFLLACPLLALCPQQPGGLGDEGEDGVGIPWLTCVCAAVCYGCFSVYQVKRRRLRLGVNKSVRLLSKPPATMTGRSFKSAWQSCLVSRWAVRCRWQRSGSQAVQSVMCVSVCSRKMSQGLGKHQGTQQHNARTWFHLCSGAIGGRCRCCQTAGCLVWGCGQCCGART